MTAETSRVRAEQATAKPRAWKPAPLPPVTGHPSEYRDRAADTASVSEHRERPLKVFAIDPSRGGGPRNVVTLRLPYEPLQPGPVGRLVAVIDEAVDLSDVMNIDLTSPGRRIAKPVNLDAADILLSGGLEPSEMDLQSHQQMIYAVSMRTIGAFERALRRPVKWPWSSKAGDRVEDRLRIYPHAADFRNAWYLPSLGTMFFGYFHRAQGAGPDRSSEIVYTALGFDLVAHEMVHPILNGILRRRLPAGNDAFAFQEGFADVVALLQHFDFHDLVVETISRTGGRIHDPLLAADLDPGIAEQVIQAEVALSNPLLEVGGQFGEAMGMGRAIRLALMGKPDPTQLSATHDPHARGAILLAAVFDAFMTVYTQRTADLRRIGNVAPTRPVVTPDLALRMAAEATKAAQHFLTICIRALDFLPTTRFTLGDYLGAIITSDSDAVPRDEHGYRAALISSFRARGIVPEGATSLTEDGLRWWHEERSRPRPPKTTRPAGPQGLPDIARTGPRVDRRMLKTFAFDPSMGNAPGNRLSMSLPYEPLQPGPVGRSVAVIDYDASNDRYYTSVNLEDTELLRRGGLDPSDIDPQFHQQMVYAVTTSTIERFETALGRAIRWPWAGSETKGTLGDRLRVYPHAMQEANAYYDRRLRALLFGYFSASEDSPGRNLPGQIVYTCLSADIVAHETTHALLDSVQPYFLEATGPDAPAFHEALADVVSLLGHFTFTDALLDTIQRTGGLIHRDLLNPDATPTDVLGRVSAERSRRNPLVDLALQFGESLGNRSALRSALGRKPDPGDLRSAFEAHDRGAILVAAIFDAFFSVYLRRVSDLLRIGRAGGTITPSGDIHPDLARRLAREATDTAARVSSIAARALDFCPPVDIEFGDYLRALVTADYERAPDDPLGFRASLIDGFRERGIYARTAGSMSEEALRWDRAPTGVEVAGLKPDAGNPKVAMLNAIILRNFGHKRREELGLDPSLPIRINRVQASTSEQIDRSGTTRTEFKVQVLQQRMVPLDPDDDQSPVFKFRGGSTVVLDGAGRLKYVISKPVNSEARLARQRAYLSGSLSEAVAAAYRPRELAGGNLTAMSLASLHRGLS